MSFGASALHYKDTKAKFIACALAFAVLTASSHIAVPIGPVPLTMQTLAITLTGILLGARLGFAVTALWVAAGFSGLPLFAMGNGGLAAMTGPTAGFLYSFPVVAAVAGILCAEGGFWRALFAMLVANFLCLAVGGSWLAFGLGFEKAMAVGVLPFVPGAVLKSLLGALILKATVWRSR